MGLSKYDSSISMFEPKVENEKAKLSTFVEIAESIKGQINDTYAQIDDVKSKRTKNNIHLAELKTKLDDISRKNNAASKEEELKELQGKLTEEEESIKEIQVAVDDAIEAINKERNVVSQER